MPFALALPLLAGCEWGPSVYDNDDLQAADSADGSSADGANADGVATDNPSASDTANSAVAAPMPATTATLPATAAPPEQPQFAPQIEASAAPTPYPPVQESQIYGRLTEVKPCAEPYSGGSFEQARAGNNNGPATEPPLPQFDMPPRPLPAVDDAPTDDATANDPSAFGPSTPSPELTAISQRAEQAARRGFDLAERGALYSARSQFESALRMMAEALDAQRNTTAHVRALGAGLRAIQEVGDFAPRTARADTELNLPLIVTAHHTPVLKHANFDCVTVAEAQRMYLTYAQQQLALAGGDLSVASLALHGLGKICIAPAEMHGPPETLADAKAVVFFQAALMIEPNNFMAANELGVRLARFGKWNDAKQALEHAVAISDAPTSWRNLAVVNDRLGDSQNAAAARRGADSAVAKLQQNGNPAAGANYPIQWVDPETFATTNSMTGGAMGDAGATKSVMTPAASPATSPNSPAASVAAKPDAKSSFWPWSKK
ncbi:MAG TPA: hypothetical protein VGJ15_06165 [Pirellulales bacterium]